MPSDFSKIASKLPQICAKKSFKIKNRDLSMMKVFTDESGIRNHRFMVLGGICFTTKDEEAINHRLQGVEAAIDAIFPNRQNAFELKWEKIHRKTLPIYDVLISLFAEMLQEGLMNYPIQY